ncbi:hypothetical protein [Bernardetia sp. MNP-M8]
MEQENRLLKKQKTVLEKELSNSDKKVILFDIWKDVKTLYKAGLRRSQN